MDFDIRRARQLDVETIARLASQLGYPTSMGEISERLANIFKDRNQAVFVALSVDKEVVGWIHVFVAQRLIVEPFVEIGGLIVSEGQRGSGVGKALLEAAEAWAQDRGVGDMRVRSNVIREVAHRFYERMDYRCVKQQNVFYKSIN